MKNSTYNDSGRLTKKERKLAKEFRDNRKNKTTKFVEDCDY